MRSGFKPADHLQLDPRYIYAVKCFAKDLTRFAIEVCGLRVTYQQRELFEHTQMIGSRVSVASGHGTGKTKSFGIIALWHLTMYHNSITNVVAPNIAQVRKQVFKEVALCLSSMRRGPYAWLAEHIELLVDSIHIKGSKETWHVLAKTAPKGAPENLAGSHARHLLFLVDEASGVDDAHFGVMTGALTEENNRMVLASQPTRNTGFFYRTHHDLSIFQGGAWYPLTFNSEESPLVTAEFIDEKRKQYSIEQYDIKVRGRFPDKNDGYLIGASDVRASFGRDVLGARDWGWMIPIDVGGGDYRDSSVMTVAKVSGHGLYGDDALRVQIVDIPVLSNTIDPTKFTGQVHHKSLELTDASTLVDYGGMGNIFYKQLQNMDTPNLEKVVWGNPCFKRENKECFINLRSQAIVSLCRSIKEGRFGIEQSVIDRYGERIVGELTRIPFDYDEKARYAVKSKKEMRSMGIPSPDIVDTFAFPFLEGMNYIVNEAGRVHGDDAQVQVIKAAAAEAFAGLN